MAVDEATERRLLEALTAAREAGIEPPADVLRGLDALFADAQRTVYVACRRIVGDEERARDLAQEALLTGFRKLPTFRGEGRLSTWLYGIAKGLSLNAVRRRGELLSEDGVLEGTSPELSVLSRMRREEREALFREASAELEPLEQEAIWLRYVEDLPQERITELLGLDQASGARGLLQRCRRRLERSLRARLAAHGHGSSFFRVTR
ncbi:MAG: sigma-70 family RNA polymerase sigma factor [Alphaproteobacteria bacterium]|nr:sigma-70 family RNA polymerase sigma factor [Alphaproteobacteria bacterium]